MKNLETILKEANARYDELINSKPDIYEESSRDSFLLGWLMQSYSDLYESFLTKDKN